MDCEFLDFCPFYNDRMPMDKGIGAIFKKKYCRGNQAACARYLVLTRLGISRMPADLYPNMLDLARGIVGEAEAADQD